MVGELASPGRRQRPPPTRPDAEIVWCGARNGRSVDQPAAAVQPGDAVDARDLDRLRARQRRQDRRQPPREHRLAGARAVRRAAGCGRRRRRSSAPDGGRVAAHVGQVEASPSAARGTASVAGRAAAALAAAQDRGDLARGCSRRQHARARRRAPPRARARAGRRARASPARARALGHRERAAAGPQLARRAPSSPKTAQRSSASAGTWPLAASTPQAIARSKPGPALRSVRGREVDGDALERELEAGVEDRRAHALARLAHGAVAEADDGERRAGRRARRPRR